ncbi:hypothetical protein ACO0LF_18505 [Undibacterium sp. Di27W]|uniref:hypothetical protein n=1 Tax=Undibacterium sp. Di27W TaxID=3413036 RepID=UPI003BF11F7B
MNQQNQVNASRFKQSLWLVLLLPACAIAAYGASCMGDKTMEGMAYLTGQLLVCAAAGAGIFYRLFLRKRGGVYYISVFLAFFIAMFAAGKISLDKQKVQANIAMQSAKEEMQRLATNIQKNNDNQDSKVLSQVVETGPAATPKASGQFGEMERFMKDFMNSAAAYKNAYLRELNAANWDQVMDFKRIKNDKDMLESKAIVEKAKAIISKFESNTDSLFDGGRAKINSLALDDSAKKSMLDGFNRGAQNSRNMIMQNWQMERKAVQEIEGMLNLLADKKKWTLQGEQLMFRDEAPLAQFNRHQQKLQEILKEQQDIQQRQIQKNNKEMDKLNNNFQK